MKKKRNYLTVICLFLNSCKIMDIGREVIIDYWGYSKSRALILNKQETNYLINSGDFEHYKSFGEEGKTYISSKDDKVLVTNPYFKVDGILYDNMQDYKLFFVRQNALVLYNVKRESFMIVQYYDKTNAENIMEELDLSEKKELARKNLKTFFLLKKEKYLIVKYSEGQITNAVEYLSRQKIKFYPLRDNLT